VTVTIPVPVYQQSMVLDCETAALQQGLAYYGIFVSQPTLFALENADTRLPVMGANHSVLRWGNPYKKFRRLRQRQRLDTHRLRGVLARHSRPGAPIRSPQRDRW
jgi:hypothetical protein